MYLAGDSLDLFLSLPSRLKNYKIVSEQAREIVTMYIGLHGEPDGELQETGWELHEEPHRELRGEPDMLRHARPDRVARHAHEF